MANTEHGFAGKVTKHNDDADTALLCAADRSILDCRR